MERFICTIFIVLLLLPLAGMLLMQPEQYSPSDGRVLKVLPTAPRDLDQWSKYPAALKDYVSDHFAGRHWLRDLNARTKMAAGVSTRPGEVLIGNDGWLFHIEVLGGDISRFKDALADPIKRYFQHANRIATEAEIPMVLAMVPHKVQMYPEYLPVDYRVEDTQYHQDIISQRIQADTDINIVELLPVLLEEKKALSSAGKDICFKHDTHWNMYGANAAQFAIAQELARHIELSPYKIPQNEFYLKSSTEEVYRANAQVNKFFSYENRLANLLGLKREWTEAYPLPGFMRDSKITMERQSKFRILHTEGAPNLRALVIHDSGFIGLAPYFSQYFSETLYWWTAAPSLLEFGQIIGIYQPDIIVWQTSQNSIASSGFQAMLPIRLEEFEAVRRQNPESTGWVQVYRWSKETVLYGDIMPGKGATPALTATSTASPQKKRDLLTLPQHISDSISGKRVKVALEVESRSDKFIQFFGVDFSSAKRKCPCVRRIAVGKDQQLSEVIFMLPEKQIEQDQITISSTGGSNLEDLKVQSISIFVENDPG